MCYILSECRGAMHNALLLCVLSRDRGSGESNAALLLSCQGEIRESTSVVLSRVYSLTESDPGRPASILGLGFNGS
jgi:hypothetical protein